MEETNEIQRIIFHIIEVQKRREAFNEKNEAYQRKFKETFDRKTKKYTSQEGELVMRWDDRREDKPKNGKFNNLWFGPFKLAKVLDNSTFILKNMDDTKIFGGPVNGNFLKH
jgi:hypothetical protein